MVSGSDIINVWRRHRSGTQTLDSFFKTCLTAAIEDEPSFMASLLTRRDTPKGFCISVQHYRRSLMLIMLYS